jgi:hypothetical protein
LDSGVEKGAVRGRGFGLPFGVSRYNLLLRRFTGEVRMRRQVALTTLLFFATLCLAADAERFSHIKIHRHRNAENRVLVDKLGKLTFDDANRKLIFEKTVEDRFDVPERVEVGYDSATKVVFEVTTHMRGGGLAQVVSAIPSPIALADPVIADRHVDDYWFYLAYRTGD